MPGQARHDGYADHDDRQFESDCSGMTKNGCKSTLRFFEIGYWFRYEAQIGQKSPRISPPPSEHQMPERRFPASMSISPPYISQPQGVKSDNTKASG